MASQQAQDVMAQGRSRPNQQRRERLMRELVIARRKRATAASEMKATILDRQRPTIQVQETVTIRVRDTGLL
jgi:hypothetical protein